MNEIWISYTVQDLLTQGEAELKTGPFGTQLHASDYVKQGIPVINVRNIGLGNILVEKLEFISEETVGRLRSHLLEPEDIVFGRKGAVERHAFIQQQYSGWFQGSDCLRLRLRSPLAYPKFISYYLLTEFHKSWMVNQCSHGSTMASLNQQIISRIPLRLPSLLTQRKITAILSAYDDLIENNTRRIAILEEMAQSLYREWFVHFRFPGHEEKSMVDSALGMIPKGWCVRTLCDFGIIVTGKTPSKLHIEYFNEEYMPFIKTPDLHGNLFCVKTDEYLSKQGVLSQRNKTLPPNSLCVSCIGTAGVVSITGTYAQTNQQINSIILKEMMNREILYFALLDLKETINQYGSNGATMVNLNKGKFESLQIIYPEKSHAIQFHRLAQPLLDNIKILQQKNITLRQTRDLLLPKLISGEVGVEELEIEEIGDVETKAVRV